MTDQVAVTMAAEGLLIDVDGAIRSAAGTVDELFTADDPEALARSWFDGGAPIGDEVAQSDPLAPIGQQEVWACGVTYLRSRDARRAESESAGGDVFYDLVYDAERPEIFFKATPHRGGRARPRDPDPAGLGMGRAGTGADPGRLVEGADLRPHHRQRRVEPIDRG